MVTTAFITYIVTDLIEAFNVGKTMNDMQTVFVVNAIKSDYFFLKPEEIKYCFNNAKKGKYGTMYDRIDAAVIFGWLETFIEERTQIAIDQNIEQNKAHNLGSIHPKYAEKLKEIFKDEKPVDMTIAPPVVREKTEQEILIQEILNEFDSLYSNAPIQKETFRTIEYMEKRITIEQFLEIRLEELKKI